MSEMQTCLWFDRQAEEAGQFYTSLFPGSRLVQTVPYSRSSAAASGQPEGSTMIVDMEVFGHRLLGLNGGPHFRPTPAISLFVSCESEREIEALWKGLARSVRIELGTFPFAAKYGWCQDRFGVDWQLMLGTRPQKLAPALLFANAKFGKAHEALSYYVSLFPEAKIDHIARDEKTQAILHASFTLAGQSFVMMEGPLEPEFDFTPGTSFVVSCDSQAELDQLWTQLSAFPQAEQCGWLCDRYGVSWQLVPKHWSKLMRESDAATRERILAAVMKMKKIDFAAIEKARLG